MKIDHSHVEQIAYESRKRKDLILHGWDHTQRVVGYAKRIAKEICPELIDDVVIAAYFHDSGRRDDDGGTEHAIEGADIAGKVIPMHWPDIDLKSILFAINHHADGYSESRGFPVIPNYELPDGVNPKIAICLWDADRLDLVRMREVNVEYLYSDFAKSFANTLENISSSQN